MTDHPEFGLLDEYVLGTLDRREALRVAKHVETCLICRRECDEIRSVFDVLPLAIAPTAPPPALRDRILAAADAPRPRFSGVTLAGALAAALLIALAGDAFLASRLVADHAAVAVASPAPTPTPHVTPAEPRAHAKVARPDSNADLPHPSAPASSATALAPVPASAAAAVGEKTREARDALTIARLKRELAVVQRQSRIDRQRLHLLEGEIARAQSVPRAVAQAPTFAPTATTATTATTAPSSPSPNDMPTSTSPDGALVATLRSGKVYTIDGTVGGEAWHLTIVQPLQGERAVMYSGTPDAPSGQTYRTWVLRDGHTVDVGELAPGKPATLQMPMALEPGDVIAFSREPIGTGDLPTQPFLMQLKIDH